MTVLSVELWVVIAVFVLGVVCGATGLWSCAQLWALTADGKRAVALRQAEQRVRDVQSQALRRMAAKAEDAVRYSTALGFTDRDIDAITRDDRPNRRTEPAGDDVIDGVVVDEWNEG